jgi:hypothetical protein
VKITLDVDRLVSEGKITQEESVRLKELASQETGSQGLNLLIGFGVLATTGGALALLRSAPASIALGAALEAAGITLSDAIPARLGHSRPDPPPGRSPDRSRVAS